MEKPFTLSAMAVPQAIHVKIQRYCFHSHHLTKATMAVTQLPGHSSR